MPELPEVEVVRRGLAAHVTGRTITAVRVHHPRAVRRHESGPADLTARLLDAQITGTGRRGKYMWLTLDDGSALVVHLGMSGQMLLGEVPNENHLRIAALLAQELPKRRHTRAQTSLCPIFDSHALRIDRQRITVRLVRRGLATQRRNRQKKTAPRKRRRFQPTAERQR